MGFDFEAQWQALAEDVISGLAEWRLQHPRATFREIEQAVDERLAKLRARMLQDAALASAAADIKGAAEAVRPVCPACSVRLEGRGTAVRELTTQHNQTVQLTRSYGVCPQCGAGLFPPG